VIVTAIDAGSFGQAVRVGEADGNLLPSRPEMLLPVLPRPGFSEGFVEVAEGGGGRRRFGETGTVRLEDFIDVEGVVKRLAAQVVLSCLVDDVELRAEVAQPWGNVAGFELLPLFSGLGRIHPFPGFFDGGGDHPAVPGGGASGCGRRKDEADDAQKESGRGQKKMVTPEHLQYIIEWWK
jgi:hypothetical protein